MKEYYFEHSEVVELVRKIVNGFKETIDFFQSVPLELLLTRLLDGLILVVLFFIVFSIFILSAYRSVLGEEREEREHE